MALEDVFHVNFEILEAFVQRLRLAFIVRHARTGADTQDRERRKVKAFHLCRCYSRGESTAIGTQESKRTVNGKQVGERVRFSIIFHRSHSPAFLPFRYSEI